MHESTLKFPPSGMLTADSALKGPIPGAQPHFPLHSHQTPPCTSNALDHCTRLQCAIPKMLPIPLVTQNAIMLPSPLSTMLPTPLVSQAAIAMMPPNPLVAQKAQAWQEDPTPTICTQSGAREVRRCIRAGARGPQRAHVPVQECSSRQETMASGRCSAATWAALAARQRVPLFEKQLISTQSLFRDSVTLA